MKKYEATAMQFATLEALVYWTANKAYTAERYPDDTEELKRCNEEIRDRLNYCDIEKIPFWVQNAALAFGGDWRRYKSEYFRNAMQKYGIVQC